MRFSNAHLCWLLVLCLFSTNLFYGQEASSEPEFRRRFVGSSAFMLANLFPNSNYFYQLNGGYWLSKKDVISLELKTWRYFQPLGIPYGESFGAPEYQYPGSIREYGLGLAYQRFWWKGLYSAVHATPFLQKYLDQDGDKIQNGFQLFAVFRTGYHVRLFKDRFFIEPSVAFTHWPISNNKPDAFAAKEKDWPDYFLFEPGFHVGFKF
jgi:hypothetical protein